VKKEFHRSSREEAHRKADEWLAKQKGLQNIQKTNVGIGDAETPHLLDVERWTVTVHYEVAGSN
jgi:hypothetical protein